MIDGRRVWLVSGRVPYARLPRAVWADRIHAAKLAGLNTIETPIFWNRHEARPGKFDFTADNDLRHFVDLIGKAGMYCILSLGPFIDSGWDFGGLPSWLREKGQPALRTTGGPYLEACSRFITAVADQIRGWQVTSQGAGGPILLLQCETEWTCGLETLAGTYLGELTRYIREAGLNVPIVNSNNLWQGVEGQIDGWSGSDDLLATMRQLAAVRPTQPRMVAELPLAPPGAWGREAPAPLSPWAIQRRLAEVLAGGGQFNISTFCGGTNFGFQGGRLSDAPDSFATTSAEQGSVITAAGLHGPAYDAVRRLAHAASRFGRVFSNLDPAYQPIAIKPSEPDSGAGTGRKASSGVQGASLIHAFGSQGGVAFVFGDSSGADKRPVTLLLPDGSSIPVPFGDQTVAWCFFNVNISARGRLDYSNLSAFGSVGQTLVVFGPAGAEAMLSVNGSPIEASVPVDGAPVVLEHEGVTLVIVNDDAINTTFMTDDAVYVGVAGLAQDGTPIALAGGKGVRIGGDGKSRPVAPDNHPVRHRSTEKLAFGPWTMAPMSDYAEGTSARFASIDGPADLTALGSPSGYGWYRLTIQCSAARRARLIFPFAGDRLHLFLDGKALGIVGVGPGADPDTTLSLHKGEVRVVMLAENLGRFAGGANMGEGKGVYGHIFEAAPIKPGKPKLVTSAPIDVLGFRAPLWELSEGDSTAPDRLTWTIQHRKRTPIVVHFDQPPASGLLVLNEKPIAYLDRSGPLTVVITDEQLARGNNTIQLALVGADMDEEAKSLATTVRFSEVVESITAEADMSFAKWEAPAASAYGPARANGARTQIPTWWKAAFTIDKAESPVFVEPIGLTKGQLYINGRHLGRYFVADSAGKAVPPQDRYLIPASWLRTGEPNEMVLFDEHGGNPSKCRLTHEPPSLRA